MGFGYKNKISSNFSGLLGVILTILFFIILFGITLVAVGSFGKFFIDLLRAIFDVLKKDVWYVVISVVAFGIGYLLMIASNDDKSNNNDSYKNNGIFDDSEFYN